MQDRSLPQCRDQGFRPVADQVFQKLARSAAPLIDRRREAILCYLQMVDEINDLYSTCIRRNRVMHRGLSLAVAVCFSDSSVSYANARSSSAITRT